MKDLSIVIPAYNEQELIVQSVSNLVFGKYPGKLEVCICDDGSTDETLKYLIEAFDLKAQTPGGNIWENEDAVEFENVE